MNGTSKTRYYGGRTPQSRTIAVQYHWFREQLSKESVRIAKIDGKLQQANILTKALP